MKVVSITHDGTTIVAVEGRVDTTTAADLEREINCQIDNGNRRILLNFADVTYISSGGMRVLLSTAKKLRNNDDKFALCCLSAEVFKVLKLTGFTSILSIYGSEGEARAGW